MDRLGIFQFLSIGIALFVLVNGQRVNDSGILKKIVTDNPWLGVVTGWKANQHPCDWDGVTCSFDKTKILEMYVTLHSSFLIQELFVASGSVADAHLQGM